MSQSSISLELPPELYERIQEAAQNTNRSLESVLVDSLTLIFGEALDTSPDALDAWSDDQLWVVVYRPMAYPVDMRLRELTTLGKQGALSDTEDAELERLIQQYDHYVLLRSKALLLLKQHGHDVESRLGIR
jgi:hypothetical protein